MKSAKHKLPKPPQELSDEAQALWLRLVEEFVIEDAAGLAILDRACEAFTRMKQATRLLDAEGLVVLDRWKQPKPHPAVSIERDSRAAFLQGVKSLRLDLEPLNHGPGRPSGAGR